MKTRLLAAFCTLLLVLPTFSQAQNQTELTTSAHDQRIPEIIHSLQQVRSIRQTQISPDGNKIAWAVNSEGIYIGPLSEPAEAHHVTACSMGVKPDEGSLAWSPDSTTLAFFSNCGKDGQPQGENRMAIYTVTASESAAPHLLAQLNGYAENLQYSPNGKFLSFLYVEGATRPSGALAPEPPPSGVIGVEHIEVQRIAAVTADSAVPHILAKSASAHALWFLTPAHLHVFEYTWSPDSNNLAYVAAPPPGEDNWWTAKLYTQGRPAAPGEPTNQICRVKAGTMLSDCYQPHVVFDPNTTTGPLHGLQIALPRFSPDGSKIAFIGGLMSDQGVTGGDIYIIPSSGGEAKDVTPGLSTTPTWLRWKSDRQVQFTEIASGAVRLNHLELPDGTSNDEGTVDFTLPETIGAGGSLMSLSFANNGTAAMIRSSFNYPPEVWTWSPEPNTDGNNFTRITELNSRLKPSWGKAKPVSWANEGFHLDGWLLYPANYDPAKKYPLIVYVHGGPAYANLAHWPGAGFGPAPFSALGYFVLMPNPRGSYGEGEKFTQANRKDFGYGDLRDILAGVDAVAKTNSIDPNRVGITGWSYGGFMTMFAITQTHRFKAAVAGAGISDWKSYYGENSIDQWMIPFFGASVYEDPAVYAKSSAINYIKNAKTPTLIVVGDRDGECPMPQSYELWHALRYFRVPTELVVYPDEGHGFHKESDRINVLERALGWFDKYMP